MRWYGGLTSNEPHLEEKTWTRLLQKQSTAHSWGVKSGAKECKRTLVVDRPWRVGMVFGGRVTGSALGRAALCLCLCLCLFLSTRHCEGTGRVCKGEKVRQGGRVRVASWIKDDALSVTAYCTYWLDLFSGACMLVGVGLMTMR